jgi:hypothetical protein
MVRANIGGLHSGGDGESIPPAAAWGNRELLEVVHRVIHSGGDRPLAALPPLIPPEAPGSLTVVPLIRIRGTTVRLRCGYGGMSGGKGDLPHDARAEGEVARK